MSVGEYRNVLYQFSKDIDWQNERERIIFICQGFLPDVFADDVADVISLLNKLVEKDLLGIDRLNVLKEFIKGIRNWDLLRIVEQFETKRKDYKHLLEQISCALDESNELERFISICRRKNLIAHEREEHIVNVNGLFKELEEHNNLGIENLGILKSLANAVEKPDLCKVVEEFETKRKQDEDAERERKELEDRRQRTRARAASVLASGINIGERVIGVVTPHCTFHKLAGGAMLVGAWMVLRRSSSMGEFVNAFQAAVLPFGNYLLAIGEGSLRFTIQAESSSALRALWESHQDKTLQTNLQEFLVTEEIKQLARSEVTLTVHIDEDEYRFALLGLRISEKEEAIKSHLLEWFHEKNRKIQDKYDYEATYKPAKWVNRPSTANSSDTDSTLSVSSSGPSSLTEDDEYEDIESSDFNDMPAKSAEVVIVEFFNAQSIH